jgi:hypothetical protein
MRSDNPGMFAPFGRVAWLRLATLALVAGCAPLGCGRPFARNLEVGAHRVRMVPPVGWEVLEHGRQDYFRIGETQLSLTDLGPATPEGMVRELRAARTIWLAGRRKDAFARVRTLHGPPLRFASSSQRLEYWRNWYDLTYHGDTVDSAAIGAAFDGLIQGIDRLPRVAPESMIEYVLETWPDAGRREIARRSQRVLHGHEWTELETWDRVAHMDPRRVAFLDDGGYLLVLAIERGPIEVTAPAFEGVLSTIEAAPETTRAK